ncbi:MAG: peptide ABC transporter substrate-binding protein, partial [Burkholderiales bacterium]
MRSSFSPAVYFAATCSRAVAIALSVLFAGCGQVWNDPYPAADRSENILYRSFAERPKTLDPARAYASDEWNFVQQIYEPPLQYHYLKRPYELVPQAADSMPEVRYIGADGATLPANAPASSIAFTDYVIHLRKDMRYQPHPAFAVDRSGRARYLNMTEAEVKKYHALTDFADTGTRPVFASDYLYQVKRLAHPRLNSPVYSHLAEYIVGLKELGDRLKLENDKIVSAHSAKYGPADRALPWLDLREFDLPGFQVINERNYRIRIKGKYPQFIYWLAMPFFAPMPFEAERFYSQRGMSDGRNITLDWFPIGSGP